MQHVSNSISDLQRLVETEAVPRGMHVAVSCQVTCNLLTSDSLPSICCGD